MAGDKIKDKEKKKAKKKIRKFLFSALSGPIMFVIPVAAIIGGADAIASAIGSFFSGIGDVVTGAGDAIAGFFTTDWESQVDPELLKDARVDAESLKHIVDGETESYSVDEQEITLTYMKKIVTYPSPTPEPSPEPENDDEVQATISPTPTISKKKKRTNNTTARPTVSVIPQTSISPTPEPTPEPIITWEEEETKWVYDTDEAGKYPYRLPWQFIYAVASLYDTDEYDMMKDDDNGEDERDYTDEELEEKEKELEESEEGGSGGDEEEDEEEEKDHISLLTINLVRRTFAPEVEYFHDFSESTYYSYDALEITEDDVKCYTESEDSTGKYRYPKVYIKFVKSYIFNYEYMSDGAGGVVLSRKYIDYDALNVKLSYFGLELEDLDILCEIVETLPYSGQVVAEIKEAIALIESDTIELEAGAMTELIGFDYENAPALVQEALKYVGIPYVWGGNSLVTGADCSGYVKLIYAMYGYELPRVSKDQAKFGVSVYNDLSNYRAGDLIFYGSEKSGKVTIDHVALYIGEGKIVHARGKKWGVRVDKYDFRTPRCVRRILGMEGVEQINENKKE